MINTKRYTNKEFIGRGGYGLVYKAKDTEKSNESVAIKKVKLDVVLLLRLTLKEYQALLSESYAFLKNYPMKM